MDSEKLTRFICDECSTHVVTDGKAPEGWVRLLSRRANTPSYVPSIDHHGTMPCLWSPMTSIGLPDGAYWCSKLCLMTYLDAALDYLLVKAQGGPC